MDDELNPDFLFRLTFTELLVKVASGEIDAKAYAQQELKNRNLDAEGKWISKPKS